MSFDNLQHTTGAGDGKNTACVNSLAYLIFAEQQGIEREEALRTLTDNVSCVCPVVRHLSIRINDRLAFWPDAAEATRWMHETAPKLLGTKSTVEVMRKRTFMCADAAIREIAPVYFDLVDKWPEAKDWAAKLRACEPVTDTRTARKARRVADQAKRAIGNDAYTAAAAATAAAANAAANAAADAYVNADANAYTAAAANAATAAAAYAYAAAAAAAYAYAAAAAAADAAAAASSDAADAAYADTTAAKILKPIMLALLDRIIEVRE